MVDIVNGVMLRNQQVLMARRTAARRAYPNTWSFPGGHVEEGETLIAALQRELLEEIGVTIRSADYKSYFVDVSTGSSDEVTFHFFVVRKWDRDPRNLGDEHSELRWVGLRDAALMPELALVYYPELFASLLAD